MVNATTPQVFVGRQHEMVELRGALEQAGSGRGRLVLLAGEPGIGKSRLADEFASEAERAGARVLWGRCWEAGGAPAYWPWSQALRTYVRNIGSDRLRTELGIGGPDLTRIIPELTDRVPDLEDPPAIDSEAARFRLFDAVAAFLWRAATSEPLVLVLDDLHAADAPSLLLLRFVASELGRAHILVVGTYRDFDIEPASPMAETLVELEREPVTKTLHLPGLKPGDVGKLIYESARVEPSEEIVSAIHRETDGNPLFVGEVVRLLAVEGRLATGAGDIMQLRVPEGIREVITRRLTRLSPECIETLRLASVLGREFSLSALERMSGFAAEQLLVTLEEAVSARVIGEVPGSLGRLRLSHALVRDTLYYDITVARRFELHGRAGQALEQLYAADIEPHLAELAAHFFHAAPGGDPRRAVDYAWRAAEWAARQLAFEEAARLYEMALRALELEEAPPARTRCDLLLALGDTRLRAGDEAVAKEHFLAAIKIARVGKMPEHLARAALGYGGSFVWMRAGRDPRLIDLLQEALRGLREDSALRVRLLARLSGAMRDQYEREPRASISKEAVEAGRRVDDPATLAYALVARYTANWGPETASDQLDIADELIRLAQQIGDRDREAEGHLLRVKCCMTLGDMACVYAAMEESGRLAEELRQPSPQWYAAVDRATVALFEGRFKTAERLIPEVLRLGGRALRLDPHVAFRLQTFQLRKEQGRIDEVEELIRRSVDEYPWYPMFRCVLANLLAHLGQKTEAGEVFAALARDDFAALPQDNEWLFGMSFLPEVAEFLGDGKRATTLYALLRPYADLNAYSPPEMCAGSVSRYLGILAATARSFDAAEHHFEDAAEAHARMGARPWLAHTQHDHARMLVAHDGQEHSERPRELLMAAFDTACELGMPVLAGKASALLERLGIESPQVVQMAAPSGVFRREGDYWSIGYEGKVLRLRDAKGLRYIHWLLAGPGREYHVSELAAGGARTRGGHDLLPDVGHGGEIIDAQAKKTYQRRVEDLREEIDEAERWGDFERAARAQEEIDVISSELAAAYGLGGRARKGADASERVRKAVTNRIRDSLARIAKGDPVIGRHLAASIKTGTFCSYAPDRAIHWLL